MKKQKLDDNIRPLSNDLVRFKDMGNVKEILYSQHKNANISIQKLDSQNYIDLTTGEVKEFQHIENRAEDKNSIRVTLGKLRDVINTNVLNVDYCKWITLTYAENMTDTVRLYKDFEKFIKRMRYKYPPFEYIVAMEPQGRGAWHAHLLLIFKDKSPFIPNAVLREIWGNGFVSVKALDNVDNIGAYLTAYLGDMELEEYENAGFNLHNGQQAKIVDMVDTNGQPVKKCIVKGARLRLYPPKFNLYRCSRGIKKPTIEYLHNSEAEKKVGDLTPTFERTIEITDENFNNIFNYRQFNIKRDKRQD